MPLAFYLLVAVSSTELLLWLPGVWRWRRLMVCVLIPTLALSSGLLFGTSFEIAAGLVLILSLYRIINLLRILENRLHAKQLYQVSRRTSYWLIVGQMVIGLLALTGQHYQIAPLQWVYVIAGLQLLTASVLMASTMRHLRTTRPPVLAKRHTDNELPTLSVLVPARNETDDLEACLQSLVASNYPKLEILVLDDCSQNKHTPQIIRDYAHTGVRFVAGKVPPAQWLAKNWAYDQLADEANGELLLFCGVDTRFQPGSLRAMVEVVLAKQKQMVSFIPANQPPKWWSLESLMVQPARYAWELALPRRLLNRPPVLSTCWLINAKTLQAAGGFEGSRRGISPESHLARYALSHGDGYSFLQSSASIGLRSEKSLSEQRATAIRTRYPQLHRRPELVVLFLLGEIAILLAPLVTLILGIALRDALLIILGGTSLICLSLLFSRITALTYHRFLLRGVWALPLVALYDLGLLNYSMWRYEFREVIWKGRNICLPILQRPPRISP